MKPSLNICVHSISSLITRQPDLLKCFVISIIVVKLGVLFAVYSKHSTLEGVQYKKYIVSVQLTVYNVQHPVYNVHSVQCTAHSLQCTAHSVQCTAHHVQCTAQCSPSVSPTPAVSPGWPVLMSHGHQVMIHCNQL